MLTWSKYPLVRVCLPFVAGILTGILLDWYVSIYFLVALWIGTFLFYFLSRRHHKARRLTETVFALFLLANVFSIGNAMTYFRIDQHDPQDYLYRLHSSNYFIVRVTEPPVSKPNTQMVYASVEYSIGEHEINSCCGRTLLYIKKSRSNDTIQYGNYLLIKNTLQPVPAPKNPGEPDFRELLHWKNIDASGFLETNQWRKLSFSNRNFLFQFIYSIREKGIAAIRRNIPSQREASVAESLLFGYRHDVTANLNSAYASAGVIHILAVAGLHVGFIALLLQSILKIIKRKKKRTSLFDILFVLSGIWLFTLLTGMSGSVVRAAVMFSILIIGNYSHRRIHPVNLLSATLLLILLVNPLLIMDVGLQLSIAAIAGIRALYPLFNRLVERSNKMMDFVWKTVSISLAAQLGTLPLALHYFNQFPVYFLIANILVIPLAGVILYVEVFFEIFHAVPLIGLWTAKLLQGLLWFMNEYIFRIQQMPLALIRIGEFDWLDSILFALLLLCAFSFIFFRRKAWLYMACGCLLIGGSKYTIDYLKRMNQQQLVIFHLERSTGFEITKGYEGYYFYSLPVDTIDAGMLQRCRQLTQTRIRDSFPLNGTAYRPVSFPYPPDEKGTVYILDTFHLAVVNNSIERNDLNQRQKVSAVLISGNPRVNSKELFTWFDSRMLIVDGSDSRRTIHYWKREAQHRNISFYCTGDSGAFIKEIWAK